ncbi:b9bf2bf6-f90c-4fac-b52f-9d969775127e [Sclerotinia trifoliorum]|uniref:B9bf2bf6-f90c-4fac-b52f-9d969775127e n=1 Tax=Sclerotinia trifoliorum TaxID=28548 RepID=A0A8H2ZJY5_9HELO|nr:b9bf2bf6-f90c-4fac-b52f-9d969775127e [Sclerotinia trifoliorum]
MPFESQQPQAQQMEMSSNGPITEQPRQNEGMNADVSMRGGGGCCEACLACCLLDELCACLICEECCC